MSKNLPANTAATAGSAEILVECITTIRGFRIRPSSVLWSAEDPQHGSHSVLCKLTSSLSLVLPVSLSIASSSSILFSCLRQLVRLCGHPSVCLLVCLHACVPVPLSVSIIAKCTMFIRRPRSDAYSEETLRRLIWGLAHVELIAFQRHHFWQWYWWMGPWKMCHGTASWCNLMLVLWSPNEFHLSKWADRFYQADQFNHVKYCVCIMCTSIYLFIWTCIRHSIVSLCAHEQDWVIICNCMKWVCTCTCSIY